MCDEGTSQVGLSLVAMLSWQIDNTPKASGEVARRIQVQCCLPSWLISAPR